jgi:hypothetical protein
VFDNYSQFEQIPENVESVVLCHPEILFDWSRNSGPVVSSQKTDISCTFQIF